MTAAPGEPGAGNFEVALATDKVTYRGGEPVALTLSVSSRAGPDVELRFSSAQRFEFIIRDATGAEVWRWSADQLFARALGTETIRAGRPPRVYSAQFTGTLPPGSYTVEGLLVATDRARAAETVIRFESPLRRCPRAR